MSTLIPIVLSPDAAVHVRPTDYLLVKLAARCNLKCTYCYWFRDISVYQRPAVLAQDVEDAFLEKLERHITRYKLTNFYILFHGGEPTLFGKARFQKLCERLRALEDRSQITLRLGITTNGLLLDEDWISLLRATCVNPTLSIDGPGPVNDARRIDFKGAGTLHRTIQALERLRNRGIEPGVLAVCDPYSDPAVLLDYFVTQLRILEFDVLVPDATHEDRPASIAQYYTKLLFYGFRVS